MSDPETQTLERELGRLKPAAAPEALVARLESLRPNPVKTGVDRSSPVPVWPTFLRWFIPAAALPILLAVGIWWFHAEPGQSPVAPTGTGILASASAPEPPEHTSTDSAEQVHIDHRLLAAFETVAEVPGRGPVRFRFSEWEDRVVVRAPDSGLSVERRTPRFEIIPIRYESY